MVKPMEWLGHSALADDFCACQPGDLLLGASHADGLLLVRRAPQHEAVAAARQRIRAPHLPLKGAAGTGRRL